MTKRLLYSTLTMIYNSVPTKRVGPLFAATQMSPVEKLTEVGGEKKAKKQRSGGALEVTVLGLSHHNAPVEVREKLAIPEDDWNSASSALCEYPSIAEAAVLSTCNR